MDYSVKVKALELVYKAEEHLIVITEGEEEWETNGIVCTNHLFTCMAIKTLFDTLDEVGKESIIQGLIKFKGVN